MPPPRIFASPLLVLCGAPVLGAPLDDPAASELPAVYTIAQPGSSSGYAVAAHGNLAVSGSSSDETVIGRDLTTRVTLWTLSGDTLGEEFGASVATNGVVIVVGAPAAREPVFNKSVGAVYVFDAASGSLRHKLFADLPFEFKRFGQSVDIDGNLIVVGSPGSGTLTGEAFLFDVTTGTQLDNWSDPLLPPGDRFGWSVAIDGTLAVMGAPLSSATNSGAAFYVDTAGGTLTQLVVTGGAPNDHFGEAVAVQGDVVLVGEPDDDTNGTDSGLVWYFNLVAPVTSSFSEPTPTVGGTFGRAIDLDLGVGLCATATNVYAYDVNSLSLPCLRNWTAPGSATSSNRFVAVGGTTIAPGYPYYVVGSGSAAADSTYYNGPAIGTNQCGPANLNSTGQSGTIFAFGSMTGADNALVVRMDQLPTGKLAYFMASMNPGFVANPPGSQGNLCLGGHIVRLTSGAGVTTAAGSFHNNIDLDAMPGWAPPDTWYFQGWYRDNNPTATSNFSDRIEIPFL